VKRAWGITLCGQMTKKATAAITVPQGAARRQRSRDRPPFFDGVLHGVLSKLEDKTITVTVFVVIVDIYRIRSLVLPFCFQLLKLACEM